MFRDARIVPCTITGIIDSTHYIAYRQGAWYELFTSSAANLAVGDLVMARWIPGANQLFLPVVTAAGGAYVVLGSWATGSTPDFYRNVLMGYALDITTAVWAAITNQPPAMYANMGNDPVTLALDASSTRGYLDLGGVGDSWAFGESANPLSGPNIWRNSGLPTGTWTQILSRAIFAAQTDWVDPATVGPASEAWYLTRIHSVLEAPGLIVVGVSAPYAYGGATADYILHSHDYGTTWSYVHLPNYQVLYSFYGMGIVISRADPNVIFAITYDNTTGTAIEIWRSDDQGHAFAKVSSDAWAYPDVLYLSAVWNDVNTVHAWQNELWKSSDKAASWASVNATAIQDLSYVNAAGTKLVARNGSTFRLSTDSGATYSSQATMGGTAQDFCVVTDGLYAFAHAYGAGANTITTINDALTEVDVTGNLHAVLVPASGVSTVYQIKTMGIPYP